MSSIHLPFARLAGSALVTAPKGRVSTRGGDRALSAGVSVATGTPGSDRRVLQRPGGAAPAPKDWRLA
jgi:hypothetical protein